MKINMRRLGQWPGGFEYVPAIFTQSLGIVLWNQVFRKNNRRSQISFLHGNFLVPDLCYSREVVDTKRRFNEVGR